MTTKRTRWLGWVLTLAISVALLGPGSALALPVSPPKIGMVCMPPTTPPSTFNLVATTGTIQTPEGNQIFMWSYADGSGLFQYPGPVLCVTQGQTVVVNLTNNLPEASSIVFPGQEGVTASLISGTSTTGLFTLEADPASTVSYSFVAGSPGTYLYESGSDISKQVEMGLYGALVVRPSASAAYAYDASTQFDTTREYMLLLSEIDPELHYAVEVGGVYDFNTLHNRYFMINGRGFPDTVQDNGTPLLPTQPYGALVRIQPTTGGSQPALIRMINAGALNHPFHPHGNHTREIAQDGRPIKTSGNDASSERFGETIASGQTKDYLIRWDNVDTDTAGVPFNDNWNPVTNPLPVLQPPFNNLVFSSPTWYSGNPYLGYKGTLPTGIASLNVCGEWYFPLHSHALNEFVNFDEPFGGMATLLRVDPFGGCFTFPASATIVSGALKSGSSTALGVSDTTYYQVKPKTTVLAVAVTTTSPTTISVGSAVGFPSGNGYYIRVDSEVMQVTAGAGTKNWTVTRGQLGTTAATHLKNAAVSALQNDWYAGFTGVPTGASNFKVTYIGKNCTSTTSTSCTAIAAPTPLQTVKICNWTIAGVAGCSTTTSAGWVILPGPQNQAVSSADVTTTWTLPGSAANYVGTGTYKGQVRVLVDTTRWTGTSPTPFSTWGNFMTLVYDAP